jgi:hypothetical protein
MVVDDGTVPAGLVDVDGDGDGDGDGDDCSVRSSKREQNKYIMYVPRYWKNSTWCTVYIVVAVF